MLLQGVAWALVALWPAHFAAASTTTLSTCSWDSPGINPYRGDIAAAVDHYTDIPAATRAALKARIEQRRYDDIAVIGRNHITGSSRYSPELRDMHFGNGRLCRTVTRQRWSAQAEERGLVYCEGAHCVIVPTVCRNVSRVKRQEAVALLGGAAGGGPDGPAGGGAAAPPLTLLPETTELQFEPPAAGPASGGVVEALAWSGSPAMTLVVADSPIQVAVPSGGGAGTVDAPVVVAMTPPAPDIALGGGSFNDGLPRAPAQPIAPLWPGSGGWGGLIPAPLDTPAAPIPEPGSGLLMLLGLAVLARCGAARRRAACQPGPDAGA
jgi:hypothetical protein